MSDLSLAVLSCDDCGACCTHIGTPPGFALFFGDWPQREMEFTPDWDIFKNMPAELKAELGAYYKAVFRDKTLPDRSGQDMPCLWYDEATQTCRHYEHRPTICREFKVGGEGCLRHRQRLGIGATPCELLI